MNVEKEEIATFAGGCFWCTEAVFQRVKGVRRIASGFTGGTIKHPPYREVITGRTGHAEAIQINFNPEEITFEELLYIFFATHDPTTLNRQQNDIGTQYRSAVFYHSEEQRETIEKVVDDLKKNNTFSKPIVTEVVKAGPFYIAEKEHQDYYNQHRDQPYCQIIIDPKVNKLKEKFSHKIKFE